MPELICDNCNSEIDDINRIDIDGKIICRPCYENDYIECDDCGKAILIDYAESYDSIYYCNECFEVKFDRCYDCRETYPSGELVRSHITNEVYCRNCFEEIFIFCYGCECEVFSHDAYYNEHDGNYYCENCYSECCEIDSVYHYDYRPDSFTYYRSKNESKNNNQSKNLYYGIELEVENESNVDMADVVDNLPEFVYAKQDGSLTYGFEIVSNPTTYQWLKENTAQWLRILDIRKKGFRSYNTNTCGIHIHLSKNYFSSLHLYKFLTVFYKPENAKFILRISQRVKSNFDRWATLCERPNDKNIYYKAKNKTGNLERYSAINLQNPHTIEIRIFRGTLNPRSFWKNIEFLQAIIDFTKITSLNEIDEPHFLTFVYNRKQEYINLHNWLWDKKFYENSLNE